MKLDLQSPNLSSIDIAVRNFPAAAVRGLNKTAEQTRSEMVRLVRARYNLQASEVREQIKIRPATAANMTAFLISRTRPYTLTRFNAAENKRGVAVTIVRGQRKTLRSAFIATSPRNGVPLVWRRTTAKRMPIEPLRTISLSKMIRSRYVTPGVKEFYKRKLPEIVRHEVKYFIWKKGT